MARNDWQRSIYWVQQWWRYWLPAMANFLPAMASFLPGMANLPVTDYHPMAMANFPMATGFLLLHKLYPLS